MAPSKSPTINLTTVKTSIVSDVLTKASIALHKTPLSNDEINTTNITNLQFLKFTGLKNEKFPTSNGGQLRDFCYIDDFIEAIFNVLNNSDSNIYGEVINIASGKPVAVKKVVKMITEILGLGQPQFGKIPYRNGENMILYADIEKAKKLLRWEPSVSLHKGLMKTIDWVIKTPNE